MSIISVKDLTFAYRKGKNVLDGIDYGFERGKMYAVTGPSGCGKTTFLSVLGGLDVPTEGEVLFDGEKETDLEKHRREHVSFVFQTYNLIDYMTPIENVKLTAKSDPVEMLEKLGLDSDEIKRNVLKLSGGQQQRVAIARALASETPVILADEPTGNLDEDTAAEITEVFRDVAEKFDRCVIVVTHSMALADKAHVKLKMDHGKLYDAAEAEENTEVKTEDTSEK